jgi:hypothetical protein
MPVPVRLDDIDRVSATHALVAVDGHGELDAFRGELGEAALQAGPFGAARGVGTDRFVLRLRHGEQSVHYQLLRRVSSTLASLDLIFSRPGRPTPPSGGHVLSPRRSVGVSTRRVSATATRRAT